MTVSSAVENVLATLPSRVTLHGPDGPPALEVRCLERRFVLASAANVRVILGLAGNGGKRWQGAEQDSEGDGTSAHAGHFTCLSVAGGWRLAEGSSGPDVRDIHSHFISAI